MKRWLPAILFIGAVVAVAWYFAPRSKTQSVPNPDISANSNASVAVSRGSKPDVAAPNRQDAPTAPAQSNPGPTRSATTPREPAKPLPYIVGSVDAPPTNIAPQIVV